MGLLQKVLIYFNKNNRFLIIVELSINRETRVT
jgi:hypothetical protein